jgi:hypothetical protein
MERAKETERRRQRKDNAETLRAQRSAAKREDMRRKWMNLEN